MTEPDVLSPKQARGCALAALVLGSALAALALGSALAALALCGCTTYTVLPADREVVPVAPQDPDPQGRRVYVEMEDGATGWFVPDFVMLELLEAD